MKQKWKGYQKGRLQGHLAQQNGKQFVVAAVAVGWLLPEEFEQPHTWSKPFEHGSARTILYVEENPIRNSYRVLVANRRYRPEERQWLDADDIPSIIRTLQEAQKGHKRAKRKLEGGILRRLFRILF